MIPQININFIKTASTFIERSSKGAIAIIVKNSSGAGLYTLYSEADIPSALNSANKNYVERGFVGAENKPSKVFLLVMATDGNLETELAKLQNYDFDYLAAPIAVTNTGAGNDCAVIAAWVESERARGHYVKAVLPSFEADCEGVINFAATDIKVGSATYTTKDYCSRIAGLLCGTPITRSATYTVLPEVDDVGYMTADEMDTAVAAGKFILMNDGEKVKVVSAVTSLTDENAIQDFKKIKIVEAADMIRRDIRKTAEDRYIGKLANTYDSKCVLLTAIDTYLRELEREGILGAGASVSVDTAGNRDYLVDRGVDVSAMSEQELKEAATGEYVYLTGNMTILDAIEVITLNILI